MSNIFSNCSTHSKFEHVYYSCTNTTQQCDLIQYVDTIHIIMLWLDFIVPMTIFFCSVVLNGYFLSILVPQFYIMDDVTRKQYVFVVSRGVSSLSASSFMVLFRLISVFQLSFLANIIIFFIDDLSFYSLLGSYVGSAILLYLAAVRPVFYSLRVPVQTVFLLASANWILSIILAITTSIFQAAMVSEGPFDCDVEHCQPVINIIMFCIIAMSFIIPIIVLSFVLLTLQCHKTRAESIASFTTDTSAVRSARFRVLWTLVTFTLISLTEAIPSSYLVGVDVEDTIFTCENFYQADRLIVPAVMASIQTLAWSIALFVDPLSGLLFDPKIKKVWVRHFSHLKTYFLWLFHHKRILRLETRRPHQ